MTHVQIIAKFVISRCAVCKLRRNLGFFCSVNHLSGPIRKDMFTCDWCNSIHFVCFCVSRFAACDRPVSDLDRPVFFEAFYRLFTVPYFFVRSFRYTAPYRHGYLDFPMYREGGRRGLNRPRALGSFDSHARWVARNAKLSISMILRKNRGL